MLDQADAQRYDDHAKNQLPRLKRTYFQKSQALEDHKRQEHAIAMQAKLLADSPTSPSGTPLREHPNAYHFVGGSTYPLSPPTSSSALPPAANPATAHFEPQAQREERKVAGRLRAGSASGQGQAKEVLNDIAQQSKKGFNAIMQKLGGDKGDREEGGFVVVGKDDADQGATGLQRRGTTARGDPTRGMGTMRGVKVKREADDAGGSLSDETSCGELTGRQGLPARRLSPGVAQAQAGQAADLGCQGKLISLCRRSELRSELGDLQRRLE